jgi:alanine racemase
VKADAYGHGMVPIARALEEATVDGLCVAAFDEAIVLRDAGIETRLIVLYPIPPGRAVEAAERRISVTVGEPTILDELLARIATAPERHPDLELEIEVETGLGRGGLSPDRVSEAADLIARSPGVRLVGLWTHLQASESADRTARQIAGFEAASGDLDAAADDAPRRHLAASGGLLVPWVPMYDAVRPGLMLYGVVPDEIAPADVPAIASELRPVMSLKARPVRVADLPAGHGISYGPTFTTGRPSRVATLPLGYGDGWSRALSNRANALVRGHRAPIVGNVAMDAVMVDVTDVAGPQVGIEDEFVLLGRQGDEAITAGELAQTRTTNSWEVVTSMSRRLPRVYDAAAGPVGFRTLIAAEDRWLGSNSGTGTSASSKSTRS